MRRFLTPAVFLVAVGLAFTAPPLTAAARDDSPQRYQVAPAQLPSASPTPAPTAATPGPSPTPQPTATPQVIEWESRPERVKPGDEFTVSVRTRLAGVTGASCGLSIDLPDEIEGIVDYEQPGDIQPDGRIRWTVVLDPKVPPRTVPMYVLCIYPEGQLAINQVPLTIEPR